MKLPLGELLNANRMFLSQRIWLRMSPFRLYSILQGYTINGQAISTLIDPHPVGVFGNYLAFRWGFARSAEGDKERTKFEAESPQTRYGP